ncbi:MAG: hypothetical protein GX552_16640 [Chloroflexi bacterium]|nr:hypothetical protein [Chloroflexota bacterium]
MTTRVPVCGRANQSTTQTFLPPEADPALLTRKGYLYVLADSRADSAWVAEIRAQYYNSASYDVLPCLQKVLTAVYRASPQAREFMPMLLVVQGLDIFAVGTDTGVIWLARFDEIKRLLPNMREARLLDTLPPDGDAPACNLYGLQQRLSIGDAVIMATQPGAQRLTDTAIRRALRRAESADKVAATLAKTASRRSSIPVPVTVIQVSGFTPIPDIGPAQKWKIAERPPIKASKRGVSPIVPALIVAACAIAFSLWFTGTAVSKETLTQLVGWMLTPVPTETPPGAEGTPSPSETPSPTSSSESTGTLSPTPTRTPTPTPGRSLLDIFARNTATPPPTKPHYPPPELLSPETNEKLAGQEVVLRWAWAGALAEDEYFDVRLWREGTPEKSIAWTKERTYTERSLPSGWYSWKVVVIRGEDGVIEQVLGSEPRPSSFYMQDQPAPTDTPAATVTTPPTRTSPGTQPTRETTGF